MSSASATAPVVLATIVAALQGSPGMAGVQVLYGDSARPERENLFLTGRILWESEDWSEIGARSRQEIYTLDGFLHVRRPGDSQQEATERAFTLFAVLEKLLRGLLAVPDAGMTAALTAAFGAGYAQITDLGIRPTQAIPWEFDEGKSYQIDFGIRVKARI